MNYIEDEYDGAAPPRSHTRSQIHLGEEDTQLMWMLFNLPSKSAEALEANGSGGNYTPDVADMAFCDQEDVGEQEPATTLLGQMVEPHLPNLSAGKFSRLGSPETSYRDWSLFGRSWADYIPGDLISIDPMVGGSTYQW